VVNRQVEDNEAFNAADPWSTAVPSEGTSGTGLLRRTVDV
jgi:hypothetical protein